jgi:uncharacterized protein with HEPN domain
MTDVRLPDYLEHIHKAAADIRDYVDGLDKAAFLEDRRTQQAVILNLLIIGEAAGRIMDRYPAYAADHPDVPWKAMRGMRNRLAHGYFDINLDIVWETALSAIPSLIERLPSGASPH